MTIVIVFVVVCFLNEITNIGKDVEEWDPIYFSDGHVK